SLLTRARLPVKQANHDLGIYFRKLILRAKNDPSSIFEPGTPTDKAVAGETSSLMSRIRIWLAELEYDG
ncbi:MAG: hypothetical protein L0Y39_01240, partial [Methylococcaceae bacterium]|nr:hypothetical protein [Methylococcaceae bacterium]